jgi:hypothetical protein
MGGGTHFPIPEYTFILSLSLLPARVKLEEPRQGKRILVVCSHGEGKMQLP